MSRERHTGGLRLWAWPLFVGVLTSIGLISALFSEGGFGDLLAGGCLAVPVAVCTWFGYLRRGDAEETRGGRGAVPRT